MKKELATLVACAVSLPLFAIVAKDAMTTDATVVMTSLEARQRYPWNGKVDIDFTFTSTIPEAFAFIHFKAEYKDANGETVSVPMKTFDQFTTAFCTNAGTYRVTWDSTADAAGLVVTNLKYTVTANMAKYMVIDLSKGKNGPWPISYYEDVPAFAGVEKGKWDDYHKTTNLVLRLIQPGSFTQAWNVGGDGTAMANNRLQIYAHTAILTKPFYMAVFELTQEQMYLIKGSYGVAGQIFTGGNRKLRPTIDTYALLRGSGTVSPTINWPLTGSAVAEDSDIWKIRKNTGSDGFDIPTESEWEYVCRTGGTASGFWNDASDAGISLDTAFTTLVNGNAAAERLGRYQHNGGMVKTDNGGGTYTYTEADKSSDESLGTAVVGSYLPNAWGIYDMHGNVAEWCLDARYAGDTPYYAWVKDSVVVDDAGATIANWTAYTARIHRGGKWSSDAAGCAIPLRKYSNQSQGNGVRLCWRFPTPAQAE